MAKMRSWRGAGAGPCAQEDPGDRICGEGVVLARPGCAIVRRGGVRALHPDVGAACSASRDSLVERIAGQTLSEA
jgi:hypothetical protein